MATIHKKVWPEYFEKIISGKKKLELCLTDFEITAAVRVTKNLLKFGGGI